MVRPCPASASYTSPSRAPAPTVAAPPATATERIGETSIPSIEERPAKQCPPLRGAARNAYRRANEIASETSAGVSQSTTACGRTSWNRAMAGLRTES
jgi:hypothetical protein